jgi:DNA polymerase-1
MYYSTANTPTDSIFACKIISNATISENFMDGLYGGTKCYWTLNAEESSSTWLYLNEKQLMQKIEQMKPGEILMISGQRPMQATSARKRKRSGSVVKSARRKPTPVSKSQHRKKFTQIASRENIKAHAEISSLPKTLNLDSPTQLTWLLRDHFGLDIKKFDDDESTGKEVLQRLSASGRDDIGLLLKYRAARKLTSAFFPTYQDLSDSEGKLHTSFNPTGTRTGRLSSSRPNLQQVPADLHRLFIARPGYVLVTRDLAAIEPAVVGYYTDDPILCELLIRGGDFHGRNAMIMFGLDCQEHEVKEQFPDERKLAKTCGLALMYGAMGGRIQATAQQMGWQWTIEKCQDTYDNFQQAYIEVFKFKQELDRGLHRGGCTTNLFGRKHSYPNRRDIFMKGFNTLIQSSASDLLLESTHRATVEMQKENIDAHPLLWVHDEIVFEVLESQAPQAEAILDSHLTRHNLMTRFGRIPLRCEGKTASFWAK